MNTRRQWCRTDAVRWPPLAKHKTNHLMAMMIVVTALGMLSPASQAHTGKGWQWYDDPTPTVTEPGTPKVNTVHTPIPQQSQPPSDKALSYSEQLKAWQAEFQEAKAAAVMAPSPEHLYRLQSLIEASWDKTHQLADAWQQTLLLHPELDYNATHPTGERAKRAFFEQKDQQVEATLAKLAREGAGLFLVFQSGDVYLHEFASQIRQFAEGEHLSLLGVSLDGSPLPELGEVKANQGKLHVAVTPAVILVNPHTHTQVAVSYGINSIDTIKRHIHFIENGYHDSP